MLHISAKARANILPIVVKPEDIPAVVEDFILPPRIIGRLALEPDEAWNKRKSLVDLSSQITAETSRIRASTAEMRIFFERPSVAQHVALVTDHGHVAVERPVTRRHAVKLARKIIVSVAPRLRPLSFRDDKVGRTIRWIVTKSRPFRSRLMK